MLKKKKKRAFFFISDSLQQNSTLLCSISAKNTEIDVKLPDFVNK